ncbi:hypothetical protein [Actinomadura roseirufa]|uniref:hypothetical protein n=1 Tax=Actinomadura roseirufa TaxID=2094049 RepID=UPI00104129F2|nr:hypothetical protein [Actinomadura roseirufa]
MVEVTAGWALFGKRPGSSDDYGVLNCSREPFTSAGFSRILSRYGLGTPPVHRSGEGALPWVAISWVGEAPDRYLGMSVEYWTEHRDGAGRPVAFTKYICVPYQAVEAAPVSYAALYRELLKLDLPMDGSPGERVTLVTPEYSPADLARDIERFDRHKVMRTAALLLDGRVDILGAGEASLVDRLAFLDAVAALLPYGYRADFTGATWATGPAAKIRLAFTRRARDGAREVGWRGAAEPVQLSHTAAGYLRLLNDMLGRDRDLAWLVGYLASGSEPRDFGDPGHALARLADVEWPREVARAVRDRRGGMEDEVRRLLRGTRLQEVDPADQSRVLAHLIRLADPGDLDLIERRWDQAAATGGTELTEAMAEAAAALLWRDEPDTRVSRYAEFASRRRFADAFLTGVVRRGDGVRPAGPARTLAAELIRDHVDPSDPAWAGSRLLVELDRDHGLAAGLLAAEYRGRDRIAAWAGWLSERLPDMLPPFNDLLAGREVDAAVFRGLVDTQPAWASSLVRVAGRLGRLELALPGVIAWLRGRRELDTAARDFVTVTLGDLRTDERGGQGASDALLMMLGSSPRYLQEATGAEDPGLYQKGVLWAWSNRPMPSMAGTMVRQLAATLRLRPWKGDTDRADAVINLVRALLHNSDEDWTPLIWVLDADPPDPELVKRPAFGELRKRLRENEAAHSAAPQNAGIPASGMTPPSSNGAASMVAQPAGAVTGVSAAADASGGVPATTGAPPGFGASPAPGVSARLAPDAGIDEVVDFYLTAATGEWTSPATALESLVGAGRALTAYEAYLLLQRVEYAIANRYDQQQADRHGRQIVDAVIGGALGAPVAAEFRDVLADYATQEIAHQLALLERTAGDAPGQPSWEPNEVVRTRLEEIKSGVERMAKQGRGGLFGRGRRKPGDG